MYVTYLKLDITKIIANNKCSKNSPKFKKVSLIEFAGLKIRVAVNINIFNFFLWVTIFFCELGQIWGSQESTA